MRDLSIKSAEAFLLVYDVCDTTTFEEVRTIRDQIHEIKNTTQVPIVIVGNKIDLAEEDEDVRQVKHTKAEKFFKFSEWLKMKREKACA